MKLMKRRTFAGYILFVNLLDWDDVIWKIIQNGIFIKEHFNIPEKS